jgi:flagellar motility protein MotE (MotC chaperone)
VYPVWLSSVPLFPCIHDKGRLVDVTTWYVGKGMVMAERDPTATVQLKFRVRESLRGELEAAAKRHGMTLNAEIVRRLEDSFQLDEKLRALDADRDRMREGLQISERHRAEAQARVNQLTDFLLQQWPNIRAQPKEREPEK